MERFKFTDPIDSAPGEYVMSQVYNSYCDESGHMEKDPEKVMASWKQRMLLIDNYENLVSVHRRIGEL